MKLYRRPKAEVSVNLTPMIDVVFLLLIFFMVSTQFSKEKSLDIRLPRASAGSLQPVSQALVLSVNDKSEFFLDGVSVPVSSMADLKAALAARNAQNLALVIKADANTPHKSVVLAMDAARALGVEQLNIATVEE